MDELDEVSLTSLDKAELEYRLIQEAVSSYTANHTGPNHYVNPAVNPNKWGGTWGGTWVSDHVEFNTLPGCDALPGGHEVGKIAQYPDGTIVSNCVHCDERITLTAVPGGYTPMQIRGFLERVIAGDAESDGELLAELGRLMAVMELEREELELAANRIEIAKTLLTRRSAAKVQEADRGE